MLVVQCEPLCFFFLNYAANARAINEPQSNVPTTNIQLVSFLILLVIGEGRNELFSSLVKELFCSLHEGSARSIEGEIFVSSLVTKGSPHDK